MNPTPHNETKQTFFDRLRSYLAPSELLDIQVAYTLAKHAHRSQTRKELDGSGNPIRYFEHCRAAALVAMDIGKTFKRDVIISCLLHDTLEDTQEISIEMIDHLFGPVVARAVKFVTKDDLLDETSYYSRLSEDPVALTVKLSDRISNLNTVSQCSENFINKQIEKTNLFIGLSSTKGTNPQNIVEARLYSYLCELNKELKSKRKPNEAAKTIQ